ncbi:MAG: hypothetical protein QOK43_2899 [Acidimicrobiaceae bacterium]|nr:hypothetical protein [Acidimicrobiaceae bacterium]
MPDTRATRALADVLVWLAALEAREAKLYNAQALLLRNRVTSDWPPIDHFELRRLLHPRGGPIVSIGDDQSNFVYGPASDLGAIWIPVVALRWDFSSAAPFLRLYIAMFVLDGNKLKANGNRFETPERAGPRHMFFHVQRITSFGRTGRSLPVTQPINTRQPAIPLDAGSPVSLVLAALVALYDVDFLRQVMTSVPSVRPYARELRCL